jgi:mxaC protein
MLAAIGQFEGRAYSGSRIILMVSDGGAQLDPVVRQRIQAGLARNRIALYWIYLRTGTSPSLQAAGPLPATSSGGESPSQELALHRFFQGLQTPYRLYEAEDARAMSAAIAEVGRQQNLPLAFTERVPRQDAGPWVFAVALAACAGLLALRCVQLRRWT